MKWAVRSSAHTTAEYKKWSQKYTTMTLKQFVDLATKYPKAKFIIDVKTDTHSYKYFISRLYKQLKKSTDKNIFSRIILQAYSKSDINVIKKYPKFQTQNRILSLYKIKSPKYATLAKYCKSAGIPVAVVNIKRIIKKPSIVTSFHKQGILVYAHTIQKKSQCAAYAAKYGIDGFMINTIS